MGGYFSELALLDTDMTHQITIKHKLLFAFSFILLAIFTIQGCAAGSASSAQTTSTITYTPLNTNFSNPERGLYHHVETRSSQLYAYNLQALTKYRTDENITLIYCLIHPDQFRNGPISADFLAHIESNLDVVRQAGLKCILRFAYTSDWNDEKPPYQDASKAVILQHIAQLKPILQRNADVIALMHAGFIGVWGEWYYTSHFVDDPTKPWAVSEAQWQNRLEVVEAELDALPDRFVVLRYAHAKTNMFKTNSPITAETAHDGSNFSRTSFHNDCFLASSRDYGTYLTDTDRQFMVDDTQYGVMGGETCRVNKPRTDCPTALAEFEEFHYSYLNSEYHPDVLSNWKTDGCFSDIENKLGYRLQLQQADITSNLAQGGELDFNLQFNNVGWAAPFNQRPVQLWLRSQSQSDQTYYVTLPADVRTWFGQASQTLDYKICMPSTIPTGQYDLLLNLPDAATTLRKNPAYSILFANGDGVQETTTGFNNLKHTVTVTADDKGTAECGSNLRFISSKFVATSALFLPTIIRP